MNKVLKAAKKLLESEPCSDPDCCKTARKEAKARLRLRKAVESFDNENWISVKDRLPSDDWKECWGADWKHLVNDFLVVIAPCKDDPNDEETVTLYEFYADGGWCYYDGTPSRYADMVTHWMPKPLPPSKKGE